MGKDDGIYYSLRLSLKNPQHIKINRILKDLNGDVYKSKNQFIVDAIENYIEFINNDELTNQQAIEKKKKQEKEYISKKDMDSVKERIKTEVLKDVRNEVIAILINTLKGSQPIIVQSVNDKDKKLINEEDKEFNSVETVDEIVDLALKWG